MQQHRGHKGVILSGNNGYLVHNIDEMADKVIAVLNDSELKEKVGKYAREYANDYSFVNVKEEMEKIYFGELHYGR